METPLRLWLDDRREPPAGWTRVNSIADAQQLLSTRRVEQLSLDYTLRGQSENGLDLVRWMAATGRWPEQRPMIHSSNLWGRVSMAAVIEWKWRRRALHNEPQRARQG